ncbi:MAG: hypothetical protein M5U27_07185 [Gaiella sp.]|nr:hypothetical protein [Gaiella sp.]
MRLALTLAVAVMIALLAGESEAAASCGPAQVGSATVRTWCGPAKATITWAGKTITVKGGACELVDYQGIEAFTVNTGRYTVPRAKPRFTSFSAAGSDTKPGTYKGWLVNFQTPGKQWTLRPTKTTVTITAPGAKKGTFSGTLYEGGKTAKGSWTC